MPDDIFDKALAAKGDIFDQAAKISAPVIPSFQDAANQSKQQMTGKVQPQNDVLSNIAAGPQSAPKWKSMKGEEGVLAEGAPVAAKSMIEMGAGGEAGALAKGLPLLARMGAAGVGGALGNAAGNVASGQKPTLGEAGKTGAAFAVGVPIGEGAAKFFKWLGASKSLGKEMLNQASAKAGNAPVELSPATNELVDKIVQQGKLGGTTPKVISDLLDRVGPSTRQAAGANPGPLTYDEARILQANAGELSAAEKMDLKGQLKHLIPEFAKSFAQDVQAAANQAGIGTEHATGMKEYAIAAARNRTLAKAGKWAAQAAGVGAGEEALKFLWNRK